MHSGRFALEFPQPSRRDGASIIVEKEDSVVVNDVQLQLALPADADATSLIVILAKEENREEMARLFYRLKSFDAIEESYRKRVKELEDMQQATGVALSKLQQERDQAKAAAEKAAEQLAKNQPGQTSELYLQAKRLFLDGKIDQALSSLKTKNCTVWWRRLRRKGPMRKRPLRTSSRIICLKLSFSPFSSASMTPRKLIFRPLKSPRIALRQISLLPISTRT